MESPRSLTNLIFSGAKDVGARRSNWQSDDRSKPAANGALLGNVRRPLTFRSSDPTRNGPVGCSTRLDAAHRVRMENGGLKTQPHPILGSHPATQADWLLVRLIWGGNFYASGREQRCSAYGMPKLDAR